MPDDLLNETVAAVRVEIEGVTASFRYPHLLIGRQPSFPMPPPSTIYGLISAALGTFPDPATLRFAYHFRCNPERVDDVELIWFSEYNTATRGPSRERNVEATSNVLPREWLISPHLTLYLIAPDLKLLYRAFREPRYVLSLGRSQDLVSVRRVDCVRLEPRTRGRFDESLLPRSLRERVPYGPAMHMPRLIHPDDRQVVDWEWYVALDQPLPVGPAERFEPRGGEHFLADPDTAERDSGRERLLIFHSFADARDP